MSDEVPVIVKFPDNDTLSPSVGDVILTVGAAGRGVCSCEATKLVKTKNVIARTINIGNLYKPFDHFTRAIPRDIITGIELEIV
ncbi:MAG: hypothetical protein WBP74_08560 [Nitrososphaeraceae archaeon]